MGRTARFGLLSKFGVFQVKQTAKSSQSTPRTPCLLGNDSSTTPGVQLAEGLERAPFRMLVTHSALILSSCFAALTGVFAPTAGGIHGGECWWSQVIVAQGMITSRHPNPITFHQYLHGVELSPSSNRVERLD